MNLDEFSKLSDGNKNILMGISQFCDVILGKMNKEYIDQYITLTTDKEILSSTSCYGIMKHGAKLWCHPSIDPDKFILINENINNKNDIINIAKSAGY